MDLVDKLLANVPKDDLGFEDIDKFWLAADRLSYPFTPRFKSKVFQLNSGTKKVSALKKRTTSSNKKNPSAYKSGDSDSESDFDYDTSSSISLASEVPDEEEELTEPENDVSALSIHSSPAVSVANGSNSNRTSLALVSGRQSTASVASSIGTDRFSLGDALNQSTTTARGRKSSLISNNSDLLGLTPIVTEKRGAAPNTPILNAGNASVSASANRNPNVLSSIKKSRRVSFETGGMAGDIDRDDEEDFVLSPIAPTVSATKASALKSTNIHESPQSATARRLSEILSDAAMSAPESTSKRSSVNINEAYNISADLSTANSRRSSAASAKSTLSTSKKSQLGEASADESDVVDTSAAQSSVMDDESTVSQSTSRRTSTASTLPQQSQHSSVLSLDTTVPEEEQEEEPSQEEIDKSASAATSYVYEDQDDIPMDNDVDYDDSAHYPVEDQSDEEPEDAKAHTNARENSSTKSVSSASKKGSSKLAQRSPTPRYSIAASTTPGSAQKPAKRAPSANALTPISQRPFDLSTPKSNEFRGGRRFSDSAFPVLTDDSAGEEEDDADTDDDILKSRRGQKKGSKASKKGGKKAVDDSAADVSMDEGVTDVSTSFIDNSFLHTIASANKKYAHGRQVLEEKKKKTAPKRGKRVFSDSEEENEVAEEEESDDEGGNVRRRSRRATKGKRFAFWKNERPLYQEGTLVGLIEAQPTPQKKSSKNGKRSQTSNRSRPSKQQKTNQGTARRLTVEDDEDEDISEQQDEEFDHQKDRHRSDNHLKTKKAFHKEVEDVAEEEVVLPLADSSYLDPALSEVLKVWDDYYDRPVVQQVVYCKDAQPAPQPLPVTGPRPSHKQDIVGLAAHYFHAPEVAGSMSGWMAGSVLLPPGAIKDAEGVGKYLQVFFVGSCQAGALEFGLADPVQDEWVDQTAQRLLLSPGDSFYVPPGNIYRLENHSTTKEATLFWMIVYPMEETQQQSSIGGMSGNTVVSGVSY